MKNKQLSLDHFYILATSSAADSSARVLKRKNAFLITDRLGNIRPLGFEMHGLFNLGTRFLSKLVLKYQDTTFLLLSSRITDKNNYLVVDLENPDCPQKNGTLSPKGIIHAYRYIFLWQGCYYERIRFTNYSIEPVKFKFSFDFDADFQDIFEIRGLPRKKRGVMHEPVLADSTITLSYEGLDKLVRKTELIFSETPTTFDTKHAAFTLELEPSERKDFYFTIACTIEPEKTIVTSFDQACEALQTKQSNKYHPKICTAHGSNDNFNEWLWRSHTDLFMMLTQTDDGIYPYAGIPWYNTVFGRDGIITAMQCVWLYPHIAKGVLHYLAVKQADTVDPERDAQPGKILHEERYGEMSNTNEVPFGLYYGSVDSTPLFIMLAGWYYQAAHDTAFIEKIWPNIERALQWIDEYGDIDKDGFIEYAANTEGGLSNQGWKDSWDSIFHADGTLAKGSIALCEVQGYVYAAKLQASLIASVLGHHEKSQALKEQAEALREKFLKAFWSEELNTYVIALDGDKRQCKVYSSNAGHTLFTQIASQEHAECVVQHLMNHYSFTTWGIRTIAAAQKRYNPMSYHNGSIWPHDNAMIALGMSRYGFKAEVSSIMTAMFNASTFMNLHRLPELFCGFQRPSATAGPTLYSVACSPQSWASACIFMLIQGCLGLKLNAGDKKIYFNKPQLPNFLEKLYIRNLQLEAASIDIAFTRYHDTVSIDILRKEGHIQTVIED
jgi:glycogen debranching enzyme